MKYTYLESPIGVLLLTGREKLESIHFLKSANRVEPQKNWKADTAFFKEICSQLEAYFKGELMEFNIEMELSGTDFQKKVWKELVKIPYGTTISYGELAIRIGNPKASRAVGMATGKNPIPIVIPCHRVIGKDGSLTGFGGGLDVKQRLLSLERQ